MSKKFYPGTSFKLVHRGGGAELVVFIIPKIFEYLRNTFFVCYIGLA